MRFNELTDKDKDYLSTIYRQPGLSHNERMDILSKKFQVVPRTIRRWANELGIFSNSGSERLSPQLLRARSREIDSDTQILLVTAAQNKTAVNRDFIKSLEIYRDYLTEQGYKAQILIIPIKYRNPTSLYEPSNKKVDDWWVDEIDEYLFYNKYQFGDTLISADSRVVPTANMPLNGYESLAHQSNLVLGHPRIHFKTLPRFKGQSLRTMNTTGFCTLKHYSKSKAGDKAYIHHSYGFTIIEKKNPEVCYKPRTVKVNSDGTFTDIINHVTNEGVTKVTSCKGIVYGDIHLENIDAQKIAKTDKLLEALAPKEVVFHDIYDGSRLNPHESKDLFIRKRKILENKFKVKEEIDEVVYFLDDFKQDYPNIDIKVVQSNHDDFIDRWVNTFDWKKDLHNSEDYLELAKIQQTQDLREYGNILGYILSERGYTYLQNHESHFIGDYQVGHHGEHGINGARGSINSFKRLNQKMIHGHSHSPSIIDGVTCVGVSCKLWQYYNSKGLSSWAHADAIIHENGKNQLIIYDDNYEISNFI